MRLFHLADLHIGKKVNGYTMIDDQSEILNNIISIIDQERPDGLILAGDIYDRRNPPIEAITVFDRFVSKVVLDLGVPIFAIGGNHDGGERLGFANEIQSRVGFHLAGIFSWPLSKIRLVKGEETLDVTLMPYADLAVLHAIVPQTETMDYANAMEYVLSHTEIDTTVTNVLVAHGVVLGDSPLLESDSERILSIGGTEYWQSESLARYDYVALGHLHQMQCSGSERIRYAGSLMQYSFSEEAHKKVMLDIHLGQRKDVKITSIPLEAPRKLVTIRGLLEEILSLPASIRPYQNDYLRVVLEDEGSLIEPMQRLKNVYPHIMLMERDLPKRTSAQAAAFQNKTVDVAMSPLDLFCTFYEQVTENKASDATCDIMKGIFDVVQKEGL